MRRALAVAAAATLLASTAAQADSTSSVRTERHVVELPGGPTTSGTVRLPTTVYLPAKTPAPAVIVSPGFGQTENDVAADARYLAQHGFLAVAWTMRGFQPFNTQAGRIALDAPDTEVKDLQRLIDLLSVRKDVQQDGPGDPRVGLMGESYGGGISLMGASLDKRVDAIVPIITWSSLRSALLPGGVFKAQYASIFFSLTSRNGCALFAERVCKTYTHLATTGTADATDLRLLDYSSPDLSRISAPTLLVQGEDDTLFPLSESLTTAKALQAQGTPIALRWLSGGHDKAFSPKTEGRIRAMAGTWFDRYLKRQQVSTGPVFAWHRSVGEDGSSDRLPTAAATSLKLFGGAS